MTENLETDPYIMYIIVRQEKTRKSELCSVIQEMNMSLRALLYDAEADEELQECFTAWRNQNIRKIVKRANPIQWEALQNAEELRPVMNLSASIVDEEAKNSGASIAVVAPMLRSETPPLIKKLQVQGLELEHSESSLFPYAPAEIHVDMSLGMSDGKLLAQVAHVIQLDWESHKNIDISYLPQVKLIGHNENLSLPEADETLVYVHDAGHTEIPANTLTAFGVRTDLRR